MKKISKSLSKQYLPLNLFLEDIELICAVFANENLEYKIKTSDYEFDNIEELRQKEDNSTIYTLGINSYDPYISINFDKDSARIHISSDDIKSLGLFYKLDGEIKKCQLRLSLLYSLPSLGIVIIIINILINLSIFNTNVKIAIKLFYVYYMIRFIYTNEYRFSVINIFSINKKRNFLQRNKDNLLMLLITSMGGVILGVLRKLFAQ